MFGTIFGSATMSGIRQRGYGMVVKMIELTMVVVGLLLGTIAFMTRWSPAEFVSVVLAAVAAGMLIHGCFDD
jgi:hypothetical protein